MGDHADPGWVDAVALDQSRGGGLTHDDQPLRQITDLFHDDPLILRRFPQDGVEGGGGRDRQPRHEFENFDAVAVTPNAELMLDRDGIETVEDPCCIAE